MEPLRKLSGRIVDNLDTRFLSGKGEINTSQFVGDFPRDGNEVKLRPLETVLERAMEKFDDEQPAESDAWVAPRLHSTLRLRRREVADEEVWNYLAVCAFPDYVRWRATGSSDIPLPKRFVGPRREQVFARLWWWAEYTWNGSSYEATEKVCQSSDMIKFANYQCFRLRPVAIAVARLVDAANDGSGNLSEQVQDFCRHLNFYLTTNSLDSIYPSSTDYDEVDLNWYAADMSDLQECIEDPVAPGNGCVPESDIEEVYPLLLRVADSVDELSVDEGDLKKDTGGPTDSFAVDSSDQEPEVHEHTKASEAAKA